PSSATPALLNAKLSWPKCSTVRATSASISVSTATSAFRNRPLPPAFSINCTDSSPSFSRLPLTTTLAPSSANAIAVAFSLLTSPFLLLPSYFSLLPSYFLLLTFYFLLLTFYFQCAGACFFGALKFLIANASATPMQAGTTNPT